MKVFIERNLKLFFRDRLAVFFFSDVRFHYNRALRIVFRRCLDERFHEGT